MSGRRLRAPLISVGATAVDVSTFLVLVAGVSVLAKGNFMQGEYAAKPAAEVETGEN